MLNKVILMGRLVADPELRQTTAGVPSCRFRIAVNRPYNKDGEQKADFINVVAWRKTAEFIDKYFSKGQLIIVEGSLRNNDYTDKNGVKHYSMDVLAEKVDFGGSKSESGGQTVNTQKKPAAEKSDQESAFIGGLEDFEEILSDGEVPF